MDFIERLQALSKKVSQVSANLATEEATKNALVMPFLHSVLGYDVFDPNEVVPEFTADTGTKKGEKVDYALIKDGAVQILIECKKYSEPLSTKHANQLFRYFSVTNARIAILTNGAQYQFYTDLDAPNKMDEKPFLTLDLEDLDEHVVPEIKKLTKSSFDVDSVVDAAGELKHLHQIKKVLIEQFTNMVRAIVSGLVADGYPADKITATAPSETRRLPLEQQFGIQTTSDNLMAATQADVIVLSVKPQMMEEVCKPLQSVDFSNKLVISIAAGINCARLNEMLATQLNLVRVMPNTPSQLGLGMSGLYAPASVVEQDRHFAEQLMQAVGKTCWVDEESGINHVIAAAGSAPAYFFLFMEAMQAEAMAQGFDKQTARLLVQQSALGAASNCQHLLCERDAVFSSFFHPLSGNRPNLLFPIYFVPTRA
ncbi:NAD(P)-binding domain-containing protein [Vibrio vulnificus]|uniref:NAD(P)-binding domain-containing protein n=1 Tax=Vibrio vulnificus TaxID=672 RepID=UPI000A6F952D|nr:NAD(P)-binding domain-containing protein [Vibrio vulnificus]